MTNHKDIQSLSASVIHRIIKQSEGSETQDVHVHVLHENNAVKRNQQSLIISCAELKETQSLWYFLRYGTSNLGAYLSSSKLT